MSELEQLQGALDAYQGEVSSAMQTTKLTQEKLQDALSVIKVLTRERDEALEIAERTHTDMHAVRKELEQQRQRAEAAEAKLAAVPVSAIWRLYFKEFGLYPIEHYGPWQKIKAWLDTQPKPESPRE